MKTKTWTAFLTFSFSLISLTGCSMTEPKKETGIPSAGTRSLDEATSDTKSVSSEILEMIHIKGKASEEGPGVSSCGAEKDDEIFFRMRHPWSFTPKDSGQLSAAMKHLKEELPKKGWKVVEYAPDKSPNKNLSLTADNDKKKFSVNIVHYGKDDPPYIGVTVISGCYQVPEGQTVDRF